MDLSITSSDPSVGHRMGTSRYPFVRFYLNGNALLVKHNCYADLLFEVVNRDHRL